MTGTRGRSRRAVVAALATWLLLITPTADAADEPPDHVDEPAPGEGQPLEDPSDPPPDQYTTSGQPSASVGLTGPSWRRPDVRRWSASQRYRAAVTASRRGWPGGSGDVVVAGGRTFYGGLSGASLAGAVNAPLLLTEPDRLLRVVADEIRRLDATKVYLVGRPSAAVARSLQRLGATVVRLQGRSNYSTAMEVARKVSNVAGTRTVIVASGKTWKPSLGIPALAANQRLPIVLAARSTGRAALTRRVRELDAQRVLVVGNRRVISPEVVSGLPNVTRLAGSSAASTVTRVARRGRNTGMRGRPLIVNGGHWADAVAWGAKAGGRDDSVTLASNGRGLSISVANYLSDFEPATVTLGAAQRRLPLVARCQVARGRFRNWFCAEQTLRKQGYVVPRADGSTDRFSVFAIYAFEKVAGLRPNGHFGNREWNIMLRNPRMKVRRPNLPAKHVEINIGKQLILLIEKGRVRNHIHTSTGAPSTPTIRGTFTVYEKRPYRQANGMYKSIFFYGGYAIHGYPSIPLHPASHGCARTYDGNQDFIYPRVFIGERVATY